MLVFDLGVKEELASQYNSYFFIGIMLGRLTSGFLSLKIKDKNLIRIGESILFIGIILLMMKFNVTILIIALAIIGFGCGPIYPAIIHSTPDRFTKKYSASVMSVQIGCAYIANISVSPLFGIVGNSTTFLLLPYVLIFFFILLATCNELTLVFTKDKSKLLKNN